MTSQIAFVITVGTILSITGCYFTWKYADFFLARRVYYVNSKFDLLKKKLSMCLSVAGVILFLTIMFANSLSDKNKSKSETKQNVIQKPR